LAPACVGESEFQACPGFDLAQDFQRRRHHFRADAVAAKHGDMACIVG
jgi:hypothetical protein